MCSGSIRVRFVSSWISFEGVTRTPADRWNMPVLKVGWTSWARLSSHNLSTGAGVACANATIGTRTRRGTR